MSTEILGLDQSIAYARHLATQAADHGPRNESYLARLAACQVTGAALDSGRDMQDAFATARAAAQAHLNELERQKAVQEQYDITPDAGDKTYLTGATASSELTPEAPVTADDPDDIPYEVAVAFINATTRTPSHRKPAGQDLQIRALDADDDDNPWTSVRIRSTAVCDHEDTACAGCLNSWQADHQFRIATVPVAVDLDSHRSSADEFYTFEGDPERNLPPYWVARHGRTVTSQLAGESVESFLRYRADFASAAFADGCCDNTPGAPGEIRAGDRIEIFANHPGDERELTVTASTVLDGDRYTVTGTDGDGPPVTVTVDAWQYKITRRPVGVSR